MKAKQIAIEIDRSASPADIASAIADAIGNAIQEEQDTSDTEDRLVIQSVICRTALANAENGANLIRDAVAKILAAEKKTPKHSEAGYAALVEKFEDAKFQLLTTIAIAGVAEGDYDKAADNADLLNGQVFEKPRSLMN